MGTFEGANQTYGEREWAGERFENGERLMAE